jgi:DNA-binding transcriptional MocR family regulator
MDLKKLLGLRPKGDTADALRAALAMAEGEKAALVSRIAELDRDRGARLLDGNAGEVEEAERTLALAQAEAARLAAMLPALTEACGNPSSIHRDGQRARQMVETARRQVAARLGCSPKEIVFTSGGTEANNLALSLPARHVVTSAIEHPAVAQTLAISLALAWWLLPALGVERHVEAIAHAVGVAVPVVTSYLGHRRFTFRSAARH